MQKTHKNVVCVAPLGTNVDSCLHCFRDVLHISIERELQGSLLPTTERRQRRQKGGRKEAELNVLNANTKEEYYQTGERT